MLLYPTIDHESNFFIQLFPTFVIAGLSILVEILIIAFVSISPCPHRMLNKHCPRQWLGAIICSCRHIQWAQSNFSKRTTGEKEINSVI